MTYHAPLFRDPLRAAVIALLASAAACVDSTTAPLPLVGPPLRDAAATATCDAAVFGPAVFTRTAGPPTTSSATFAATPGAFYRLEVSDQGTSGGNATVRLNGVEVVTSHDLAGAHGGSIAHTVTLAASNVLEVRQTGRPGSQLALRIVDTRTAASVRITPQTVLLLEVRQTFVYTAEVLDAEGHPISRCVTWSSSNPAAATVTGDGHVQGVASGSTNLVARVGDVQASLPITVVQRTGPNQGTGYMGYCAMSQADVTVPRACFDAIVQTSAVEGGQTLIELSLRNRQGSQGGEALPPASLVSVFLFGTSGAGPMPLFQEGWIGAVGWSLRTSGMVEVVGSPTMQVGDGRIAFPSSGGLQNFQMTSFVGFALFGCATTPSLTPSSYWQTCGDHAGTVNVAFVSNGAWTATDLILFLGFDAEPHGIPVPNCATRLPPGALNFPALVCQQRLPILD